MMFFIFGSFSSLILLCYNYNFDFKLFMIKLSYNLINLFSKLQIYFYKVNKELNKIIEQNPSLLNFKNNIMSNFKITINDVELIKDGIPYKEIINDYDFIVYSDNKNGTSEAINKIIFDNKSNISNNYELSNIKFIMLELNIGEKFSFIIDLKKNNYNFYIVGNNFNLKFFEYYIKSIMKENFIFKDDDKITLHILDENVNDINIELKPKNQSILLEKSNYKIIN